MANKIEIAIKKRSGIPNPGNGKIMRTAALVRRVLPVLRKRLTRKRRIATPETIDMQQHSVTGPANLHQRPVPSGNGPTWPTPPINIQIVVSCTSDFYDALHTHFSKATMGLLAFLAQLPVALGWRSLVLFFVVAVSNQQQQKEIFQMRLMTISRQRFSSLATRFTICIFTHYPNSLVRGMLVYQK